MSSPSDNTPALNQDDIIEFLKENPDFLAQNFDKIIPPKKRAMRGKPADFQAYMIERLKNDKQQAVDTTRELVENSRANMNNQQRINEAVLRLLEANDFSDFIHTITMDLTSILNVDITTLIVESDGSNIPHIDHTGIRIVPEGTINNWMEDKQALLQDNISGIEAVFGNGASLVRSQLLLRIDVSMETPPAILAFGSRDADTFHEGQATDQILFLARALERTMRLWLRTP